MSSRSLLNGCADMHIMCARGEVVKACKFVMVANSKIIGDLYSSFDITSVPLHTTPADCIRAAVDIIHGIPDIDAMGLEEVVLAQKGLDILDSSVSKHELMTKLWKHVSCLSTFDQCIGHAPKLLFCPVHQAAYLAKLKKMCPYWIQFKRVFDEVTMNRELAIACMRHLAPFFNPLMVFRDLACMLTNADDMVDLFCAFRTGVYYHPMEMMEAIGLIRRNSKLEFKTKKLLDVIHDGLSNQELIPAKKSVYGTSLVFVHTPLASSLLFIESRFTGVKVVKCSPWMKVWLDLRRGTLDAELRTDALEIPRLVSNACIRLSAIKSDTNGRLEMTEVCRDVTVLQDAVIRLSNLSENSNGMDFSSQQQLFASFLKHSMLKYIRIDLLV